MNGSHRQIPGEWSLGRWLLLGVFGIALAVAIALAAGSLASQPVGLSGEPVSAGSALEPARDNAATTGTAGSGKSQNQRPDSATSAGGTGSDAGGSSGSGYVPPVTVPQTEPQNPVASGGGDDSVSSGDESANGGGSEEGGDGGHSSGGDD